MIWFVANAIKNFSSAAGAIVIKLTVLHSVNILGTKNAKISRVKNIAILHWAVSITMTAIKYTESTVVNSQ